MKEYDIIISDSVSKLIQVVNKQCREGWEPTGGMAAWPTFVKGTGAYLELKGHQFAQAIVRAKLASKKKTK